MPALCAIKLSRTAQFAAAGRRDRRAVSRVFVELVAQRPDRDAEDIGGMGAVAEAVLERLQNQVALDVGDSAAGQMAGALFGRQRGMGRGAGVFSALEPNAIGAKNSIDT